MLYFRWVLILYLLLASWLDLKNREIPLGLILVTGIVLTGGEIFLQEKGIGELLTAVIPGSLLLLLAFFSGEKIGYGDGFSLVLIGFTEGGILAFTVFTEALFFAAICGLLLYVTGKVKLSFTLPFLPFLTFAFWERMCWGL